MVAAKPGQSKADRDDELIIYRLTAVETLQRELNAKFDKQDNIKRADLIDFKDTIKNLVLDIRTDLQRQINEKADQQELKDLKKQFYAVVAFLSSLNGAVLVAFFTRR